jgi:uncharacterized protein YjbI with pentapeptide repeats
VQSNLKTATFNNTNLSKINFTNFPKASLRDINLSGNNLAETDFTDLDLLNTVFKDTNLSKAIFVGAGLNGANLSGANLNQANLSKTDLNVTDFSKASLVGADLTSVRNFSGAKLLEADLTGAKLDNTFFKNVFLKNTILAKINFSEVPGIDYINLAGCNLEDSILGKNTFEGENIQGANLNGVDFSNATITTILDLSGCEFSKGINFSDVTFSCNVYFDKTKFSGGVNFTRARFEGEVRFEGDKNNKIFSNAKKIIFNDVTFDNPPKTMFIDAELSKCSFFKTDVSEVDFTRVTWDEEEERDRVYDEVLIEKEMTEKEKEYKYEHVEKIYRQLKVNYERKGDYARAGDFHFGEMEMRRYSYGKNHRWYNFLANLYRLFSGYGERSFRPLVWFLVTFLFFSIGNMLSGLETKPRTPKKVKGYNYNLTVNPKNTKEFWNDYLRTLEYTYHRMTLRPDPDFKHSSYDGFLLTIIQNITGPLLIGLIILAIKRKFKR